MFYELYKVLQSKAKSKEDEEKELTEAFEFFDGENSGYIDIDYFKKALMSFGNKLTENEVDKLLEHVSFDKTNKQFKYKELIQTILKK
jgi:Ca2+-binding EF-hand superfamily protein